MVHCFFVHFDSCIQSPLTALEPLKAQYVACFFARWTRNKRERNIIFSNKNQKKRGSKWKTWQAKHEQQLVSSSFNLSQSEAGQELANICAHMELHYPTIYIASFPVMYVALSHKETLFRHRMFYFRLHVISLSCVTWH